MFASWGSSRYADPVPTRRELNRAHTVAQIKRAALEQIAAEGAPALSIRAVGRSIGMSPAGLYRYYASRDELLTDLLVDAYTDLAEAVARGAGMPAEPGPPDPVDDVRTALLGAIAAYRAWAVAQPSRFLLIFGSPVPGYHAPEGGPTVAANRRMGQVFFALGAQAWREGLISAPSAAEPSSPEEAALLEELRAQAPGFPAGLIPVLLGGWALWHGLTILEVTGQLHWAYPDTGAFYTDRVTAWVDACLDRG